MIYVTTLGVKQGRSSNNYVLNTNTSSQKRILVVDDQQERAKLFAIALKDNGFVVNVFNDPLSALSNFKAGLYDLLLLDIKMPSMNGFEFCQKIKDKDNEEGMFYYCI